MSVAKLRAIYPPIIRLVISLIVLGIINAILVRLPGINVRIPGSPIRISAVVSAVIAVIMIGIVMRFGREINPPLRYALPSFPEVADVVTNLVYIGAIAIAYVYFADIVYPFLVGASWVYPLVFLAIAILPAVRIASTLLGSVGKWTAILSKKVEEVAGEYIRCPKCGELLPKGAKFCSKCGASLAEVKAKPEGIICPNCGARIPPGAKFCPECGAKVE